VYSIRHEGYGPADAAVLVDCLTDDRERTAGAVRSAFLASGGRLGAAGSVAYLFNEVGRLVYAAGSGVDSLLGLAWAAGAEDVMQDVRGTVEVRTDPIELESVEWRLAAAGFTAAVREVTWRAAVSVPLEGAPAEQMTRLIDALERLDDVQSIYTNAEVAGEVLASI
jgi:transcriptional/translational regulatory protein YebC/TACO1